MPIIAYDPSEGKKNTRLPQDVIETGTCVNRLEEMTGADLLVSPLDFPLGDLSTPRGIESLRAHVQAGVLIQRKTGRDALSSIPNYDSILYRMLQWTARPYLVLIGQFTENKAGKVIVDGQLTDWNYSAFLGALDWWQLSGGYVTHLSRDGQLARYLRNWITRTEDDKWEQGFEHKVSVRMPKRILSNPDWVSIVLSLGIGFGNEKVTWLEQSFNSFADFLEWFSNPCNRDALTTKNARGIGDSQFSKVRKLLGLGSDEIIHIQKTRLNNKTIRSKSNG